MPQFEELKESVSTLKNLIVEQRTAMEDRFKAFESRFNSSGDVDEKLTKINAEIEKVQDKLVNANSDLEVKVASLEATLSGPPANSEEREREVIDSRIMMSYLDNVDLDKAKPDVDRLRAYKKEYEAYMRRSRISNAMQSSGDETGGYWLTPAMSSKIVDLVYETSEIRKVASIQTIGTDRLSGKLDLDEASAGWVGERQPRTETRTPTIGEWAIPIREVWAMPSTTQNFLDDSVVNVQAWLTQKVSAIFARMENTAFVRGDSALQPKGFLSYLDVANGENAISIDNWGDHIQHIDSGADASLGTPDSLIELMHMPKDRYQANARWAMSRMTLAQARQLKSSDGNTYHYMPDFRESPYGTFHGKPISTFEDLDDPTRGSVCIIYGDFKAAYQIVDRQGIRSLRDPYTVKGYVSFYSTKRVGGDIIDFDALKFMRFSS